VYLIARGHTMAERSLQAARARDTATRAYIQQTVSGTSAGSGTISEEIAKLTSLKEQGLITDAEFETLKAKAFAR
jgi:proline racemase